MSFQSRAMTFISSRLRSKSSRVTIALCAVYFIGISLVMMIHLSVPSPASKAQQVKLGVNLTEAWQDLRIISSDFHPYNSKRNDQIHHWLLTRIESILQQNNVTFISSLSQEASNSPTMTAAAAVVFDDNVSNLTFSSDVALPGASTMTIYFESKNIIVYIRGELDDPREEWWTLSERERNHSHDGGVLINAHYDSVSTGYGATDDGVGIVSILQIINHFTNAKNTPKRGIVCLLNNGEEDFLNGAHAFTQHPISSFPKTFLNLEGAGAGGRAILFRSTDSEVTRAYAESPHPFGSVVSDDGFSIGLIRSQTDYIVFNGMLGMRGLDVAFWQPRARYHTTQDDAAHTSPSSVWHMLSASIRTMESLTSEKTHDSSRQLKKGVWFDILGSFFIVLKLDTLKSISVFVLIAFPLLIISVPAYYLRTDYRRIWPSDRTASVLRTVEQTLLISVPPLVTYGMASLVFATNPMIVYSSQYSIWAMSASSCILFAWLITAFGSHILPTSSKIGISWSSIFIIVWLLLFGSIIVESKSNLSGLYFIPIYFSAVGVATILSTFAHFSDSAIKLDSSDRTPLLQRSQESDYQDAEPESSHRALFSELKDLISIATVKDFAQIFSSETGQVLGESSSDLYNWTMQDIIKNPWLVQIALVIPTVLIVVLPVGLIVSTAMDQTGADGNSMKATYAAIALFTWFAFAPAIPFLHYVRGKLPVFVIALFLISAIYNLTSFPFSANNRLKIYFAQTLDLDTGFNNVSLYSIHPFLKQVISSLPSASNQSIACDDQIADPKRNGLKKCSFNGLQSSASLSKDWLHFTAVRSGPNSAEIELSGINTRSCRLYLDIPATSIEIVGSTVDPRFSPISKSGSNQIRLWSRTWDSSWTVNASWNQSVTKNTKITGRVSCNWSDVNKKGVIPAFDEALKHFPSWAVPSKEADGLVEAYKAFSI